ncbi:hypothetical protein Pmgp_02709 [Pelotomaculum propionicicum]|uniref:Uncharacterized protein n=2 Tax=Pelotomaculum propionicicum TaxID=258475 RepID=A0A4Y7RLZ6_9FIRM|nr:hypothetical protein Pmgp_02709 [Pelotomaculum propionicicum]
MAPPQDAIVRQIAHYGQQAVIDAFLNVMKECSLGLPILQQLHRPDTKDTELNQLFNILYDLWTTSDEAMKGWIKIQFHRAFPDDVIEEAQKKQKETQGQASAG